MSKVIDYKVIVAMSFPELEEKVKAAMNKGWDIWGSIQSIPDESRIRRQIVCQVMVKFAKEN